jgi:hypothetical protein
MDKNAIIFILKHLSFFGVLNIFENVICWTYKLIILFNITIAFSKISGFKAWENISNEEKFRKNRTFVPLVFESKC